MLTSNQLGSEVTTSVGAMPDAKALPFDPIDEARRQWIDHDWDDAAEGMAVITSIFRVEQILLARIDAVLRPLEVTFARYELLTLLHFTSTGALPLGKIGARLQVHPASITNAVNRLEADGLVKRVAHPDDGRTTLATLTPAGRKLVRRATDRLNAEVFSELDWDEGELKLLFDLLRRFRHAAGDFA